MPRYARYRGKIGMGYLSHVPNHDLCPQEYASLTEETQREVEASDLFEVFDDENYQDRDTTSEQDPKTASTGTDGVPDDVTASMFRRQPRSSPETGTHQQPSDKVAVVEAHPAAEGVQDGHPARRE